MATSYDLQREVLSLLQRHGFLRAHFRAAIDRSGNWTTPFTGDKGFPDIAATDGTDVLFAELKSERGRLTEDQKTWIGLLKTTTAAVHVWRPSDLMDGRIERTLLELKEKRDG